MRYNRTTALVAGLFLLGATGCTRLPDEISAWAVDWRDAYLVDALVAVKVADGLLSEIDMFRYHLTPDGTVVASRPLAPAHRALFDAATERGLRISATLANDVVSPGKSVLKDHEIVSAILADQKRRARLVEQVRTLLREEGYHALDLDFEQVRLPDRDRFSELVEELAAGLHEDGRRLTVTVHPRFRDVDVRRHGPGAQDLARIARAADEIRVMGYHHHHNGTDPGPAAPVPWLREVIERTLRHVPPEKVSLALYVGGWQWNGSKRAKQLTHDAAVDLARSTGATVHRSEDDRTPHFRIEKAEGSTEVWFEDGCSLLQKARLAAEYDLAGIALWHLGKEDYRLFTTLRARECPDDVATRPSILSRVLPWEP